MKSFNLRESAVQTPHPKETKPFLSVLNFMEWTVTAKKKVQKQVEKLPPNVIDKEIRLTEVSYVGTHEKAPY